MSVAVGTGVGVRTGGVGVGATVADGLPIGEREGDGRTEGDALRLGEAEGDGHGPSFMRTFDHGKRP